MLNGSQVLPLAGGFGLLPLEVGTQACRDLTDLTQQGFDVWFFTGCGSPGTLGFGFPGSPVACPAVLA